MRYGLGTLGLIAPRDVITHFRGFEIPWTIEPDLEIISGGNTATITLTLTPDLEIISSVNTATVSYTIEPDLEIISGASTAVVPLTLSRT